MDMDSMMKKMMGNMGGMSIGNSSSMLSSSSSFSSSSTMQSSSNSTSTMMGGGMPSLGGMGGMGSLDIEELSTAGTDITNPPSYTVTSPPPLATPTKGFSSAEMSHTVKPTADFKPQNDPQADCTVLLKIREGKEYKLVLNMQQYKPENITVKLNERELTVAASEGGTDDFCQKHMVPEGIDLDQLSSSFSADGILVIKAPRMK